MRRFTLIGLVMMGVLPGFRADAQETQPKAKTLIDYFLPMPIKGSLDPKAWGAPNVLPRDPRNGLEDPTIKKYCYWDGQIINTPDGKFEISQRDGRVLISDNGVTGPYKSQGRSVFPKGIPNLEDPTIWYSGGLYHIVVNSWSTRKAYHLTSADGIHDWTNRGLAYDPTTDFIRYTDGTVNHWNKIERPAVFLQNGHVTHFTFAVIDVPKDQDRGNDIHGSKVIVVPFDGEALDRDLAAETSKQAAAPSQK